MKAFVILALVAAASASPIIDIHDDGTYHMKAQKIEPQSFYDEIWDNQFKYLSNDFDNAILNGQSAALGQFPHAARLTIVRSTGTGVCSGSFIQPNLLLTASHCVNSNPHLITSIGMLIGTVNRGAGGGGVTMQMAEFWWHPQPATLVDDIALVRSTANIPTGPNTGTIRIPSRAQTNFPFHGPVRLIGWGVDNSGALAMNLQFADFTSVPLGQCTAAFREPSEICYRELAGTNAQSQGGDSGGPVIIDEAGTPTQVGIHAGRRFSGGLVFHSAARVSAFLPWLEARGVNIRA